MTVAMKDLALLIKYSFTKQRMSPRSIGHCYHRSISYCFSSQKNLCSVFQLCKEKFQINPPVFSTWKCYEKRWRTMTPCIMMGYPMLEIFGSASPEVITTFYVPRKAPQHLYVMCIFCFQAVFSILEQLVGICQWSGQIWRRNCPHCYLCVSEWYYKEIIQIVGLQEIIHRDIVINVAPILLLVFLLVLNRICHQLHRETTKGKNSQKFVLCGHICYASVLRWGGT